MEPELVTRCHRRTKNFILEKIPEKISQTIYNVESMNIHFAQKSSHTFKDECRTNFKITWLLNLK